MAQIGLQGENLIFLISQPRAGSAGTVVMIGAAVIKLTLSHIPAWRRIIIGVSITPFTYVTMLLVMELDPEGKIILFALKRLLMRTTNARLH